MCSFKVHRNNPYFSSSMTNNNFEEVCKVKWRCHHYSVLFKAVMKLFNTRIRIFVLLFITWIKPPMLQLRHQPWRGCWWCGVGQGTTRREAKTGGPTLALLTGTSLATAASPSSRHTTSLWTSWCTSCWAAWTLTSRSWSTETQPSQHHCTRRTW